jgi:cytochrome c
VRTHLVAAAVLTVLAATPAGHAQSDQEAAKQGRTEFEKICANCHGDAPGKTKIGPSLFGVVGRESGTAPGFTFTTAMKEAHITWTAEQLDKYLENPRGMVPGTKMGYAGVKQAEQRHAVVAYLETLH